MPTNQPDELTTGSMKPEKHSIAGNLIKYGIPLVITLGLCWLLFHNINFSEMMEIIRRDCNFWWIGLALVISIFSHVFRAMRWRIQLRALNINASLWDTTLSIFGTYAVNLVFPRLGEVWRTGYIAQKEKASFTTVFGSMVADRLADTVTVLLLTLATFIIAHKQIMLYLSQNGDTYRHMAELLVAMAMGRPDRHMRNRVVGSVAIPPQQACKQAPRPASQPLGGIFRNPQHATQGTLAAPYARRVGMLLHAALCGVFLISAYYRCSLAVWRYISAGMFRPVKYIDGCTLQRRHRTLAVGHHIRA